MFQCFLCSKAPFRIECENWLYQVNRFIVHIEAVLKIKPQDPWLILRQLHRFESFEGKDTWPYMVGDWTAFTDDAQKYCQRRFTLNKGVSISKLIWRNEINIIAWIKSLPQNTTPLTIALSWCRPQTKGPRSGRRNSHRRGPREHKMLLCPNLAYMASSDAEGLLSS